MPPYFSVHDQARSSLAGAKDRTEFSLRDVVSVTLPYSPDQFHFGLSELGTVALLSLTQTRVCSVANRVLLVHFWCSPHDVIQLVVLWFAIKMTALHILWSGTNKGFE